METDQSLQLEPVQAMDAVSRAEIDMQIATAKKYPRILSVVKQQMMSFATLDQETAASCFYTLPRGGKTIQGPAIRLAELAISCYGNVRVGTRLGQCNTDSPNPYVVVVGLAHDLQNNVAVQIEKRRRITKKKYKDAIDDDDINLAVNSCSAIAFRDVSFKIVPMALIKPVYEAAKQVAIGDAKTLASRREQAMDAFAKMGVTRVKVLLRLGRGSIDDVQLSDLETLLGLYTAIKDGETTIDNAFPEHQEPPAQAAEVEVIPPNQPEPKSAQEPTKAPHEQLAALVESAGHTLDDFKRWAAESQDYKDADSIGSWDEWDGRTVNRWLRIRNAVLHQLDAMKGGAK
jgi:hypothetical protein